MAISGDIQCFVQAANGHILLGTNNAGRIYRSTNEGITWTQVVSLGPTCTVTGLVKDGSGRLFASVILSAATQGIWRSLDNGASWTRVKASTSGNGYMDIVCIRPNNRIVAVGYGNSAGAYNATASIDGGTSWIALDPGIPLRPLLMHKVDASETGLLAWWGFQTVTPMTVQTNPGDGSLSTYRNTIPVEGKDTAVFNFLSSDGRNQEARLWAAKNGSNTEIYKFNTTEISFPGTPIWAKITTITGAIFNCVYTDPATLITAHNRTLWAGANGSIYVSYNNGNAWSLATDGPVGNIYAFIRTTAGTLIAGGQSGEIFIYSGTGGSEGGGGGGPVTPPVVTLNAQLLGSEASCEDQVYVANKSAFSNITHVTYYNGSTYTELQFATAYPYYLFGTSPATGRIIYFGSKTSDLNVPGGTFSSVVFDLTQAGDDITVAWEYWNSVSWTALTVQDNTNNFHLQGVNSVHWAISPTWSTVAVNGVTGYWVRARITATGSNIIAPIHSNRYIYTVNLPYVEIDEDQIKGDLPALMRVRWNNKADDLGANLTLNLDRLICGLRSVDRGQNFNSYINISDLQTPFGVTITKDTDAIWGTSFRSPTNHMLQVSYSSAGRLNTWNDLVTFTFSNTVARDYYGQYRAFVRCYKYGTGTANWKLRLKVIFGSGGGGTFSRVVFPTNGGDWEAIDFGPISLPTIQVPQLDSLGDQMSLTVQGYNTATGIGITFYDLILIPHDEWAIDAITPDASLTSVSDIKGSYLMDVDSITNPKVTIASYNRNSANQIVSRYQAINNGPAILQKEATQRLWFMGLSYEGFWRGLPEITGSVQVYKTQRYLGWRGAE